MSKAVNLIAALAAVAVATHAEARKAPAPKPEDPHLWLEDVEGAKALDWVRAENARSLALLESDPRFQPMKADALSILTSKARIPYGAIGAGHVWNFWQDDKAVRGIWRRADVESYRKGAPRWETLVDYDALAKAEGENWIAGSTVCLAPERRYCMVELSKGGKDAGYWREFDATTKTFAPAGFALDEAKSAVAWIDKDTLLVGTDREGGALTDSGYAKSVRIWKRGSALKDAPIFLDGQTGDVSVSPFVDQDGGVAHVFGVRSVSFFENQFVYAKGADGAKTTLPLPANADLSGVLDGRAIFFLRDKWSYQGTDYPLGSVVAYDLGMGAAELVMAAGPTQSIETVATGKSNLVVQYLDNVSGKAARLVRGKKGGWTATEIALPANGVVKLISAGGGVDDAMLSFQSLTTPDSLYFVTAKNKVSKIASAPEFFDAKDVVVEQRFATSKDGTRIPYFVMGRKDVLAKGNAPTVQYGYGGFLVPTLPVYYADPGRPQHGALAGKMWVARGGVLVLSNIRGGSEFGPAWHQAALKENRQKSFDDFIAISEDLIRTGVTSASRLGAIGRSNGGLLMGAIMTQRPDLYAAIDIGVPLFDMKRYNKLLAGASWMAEFGDPDKPAEWAYISQYSPYQHLKKDAAYPKVFFYTSTKDDRVHPGHARKAVAKLKAQGHDVLYYENIEGGHGGTANQDQLAYRTALEYAYFAHMLMGDGATAGASP
ncbi:MAG: prolyl oligopeptidase family serine peptidase [Parvularculaceae bacterium]|nr:prolyl oligopeptidase family serine peptidase [Parvularculaceae bacterium]